MKFAIQFNAILCIALICQSRLIRGDEFRIKWAVVDDLAEAHFTKVRSDPRILMVTKKLGVSAVSMALSMELIADASPLATGDFATIVANSEFPTCEFVYATGTLRRDREIPASLETITFQALGRENRFNAVRLAIENSFSPVAITSEGRIIAIKIGEVATLAEIILGEDNGKPSNARDIMSFPMRLLPETFAICANSAKILISSPDLTRESVNLYEISGPSYSRIKTIQIAGRLHRANCLAVMEEVLTQLTAVDKQNGVIDLHDLMDTDHRVICSFLKREAWHFIGCVIASDRIFVFEQQGPTVEVREILRVDGKERVVCCMDIDFFARTIALHVDEERTIRAIPVGHRLMPPNWRGG